MKKQLNAIEKQVKNIKSLQEKFEYVSKHAKMSDMIDFMCDALREYSKRKDVEIYLRTFHGYNSEDHTCVMCVAGAAALKLACHSGKQIYSRTHLCAELGMDWSVVTSLEERFDRIRLGCVAIVMYDSGRINRDVYERLVVNERPAYAIPQFIQNDRDAELAFYEFWVKKAVELRKLGY